MAATISRTVTRTTISGAYKAFTGNSTATVVTFTAGEAPAVGDVGRFVLWCRGGTANTAQWEVRRIIAATATTATVHDAWGATPTASDTFRISSTLSDILVAQPLSGTKTGESNFVFVGDLSLTATAFLGSANESAEWVFASSSPNMPMSDNCVLQLGQLWGGEGVGTETTDGSRWFIRNTTANTNMSIYSATDSRSASGPVVNYYGSLFESSVPVAGAGNWMFQRFRGPSRLIGSIFDGIAGGRFYHESSEWLDCRMSSGSALTVAWSIGATFTRPIASIKSYRNIMAMKSYLLFGGVVKNTVFSNNTGVFQRDATGAGSVFEFIDCTEFSGAQTGGTGGVINQSRSVNLTITDESGGGLAGAAIRINNKDDATQGAVVTSGGTGAAAEILARRLRLEHGSTSVLSFAPFRIRIRRYGYLWASLNADIADPIKQSTALLLDGNITQASAVAAAHTGVTLTDHGVSPVTWNGKAFGITVTGNKTTNSSLTLDDIKHYLHYHLAQSAAIGGKASGLDWHNLIPMNGAVTDRGSYGATNKGVRVVDELGNPYPGVVQMQADDGTYYVPPVSYILTLTGLITGSDIVVLQAGISNILTAVDANAGTSYGYVYETAQNVDIGIIKPGHVPLYIRNYPLTTSNASLPIAQTADRNYQ